MLLWFQENLATILVCMVLAGVVALIIGYLVRQKKQGKTSCGCNCASCAMRESCHRTNDGTGH